MSTRLALAADHGGLQLKNHIRDYLTEKGFEIEDFGTHSFESCDYADFAAAACRSVQNGKCRFGILFCSTGIGVSMAANKMKNIRACVCSDTYSAEMTRRHNDANILCLGGLVVGKGLAERLVDAFLIHEFEGGRHQRRIDKVEALGNAPLHD